jgi:hypothetical protein
MVFAYDLLSLVYNAHGHIMPAGYKLRFPAFEKARFVTALGIISSYYYLKTKIKPPKSITILAANFQKIKSQAFQPDLWVCLLISMPF